MPLGKVPRERDLNTSPELVEAQISHEWTKGAYCHRQGRLAKAVNHWSRAMMHQAALARHTGADERERYFRGASWVAGIGHIALLASYAQARILGLTKVERFVVVMANEHVANQAYLEYLSGFFEIVPFDAAVENAARFRTELPSATKVGGKWMFVGSMMGFVQQHWLDQKRESLLTITPRHRTDGWEMLKSWGVPNDAWFVTLHVRERGLVSGGGAGDSVRNAEISDYIEAIQRITDAGGWVIRTGDPDYTPLAPMRNVIDYATGKPHQDWMDVFLLGCASFMIATNSGPPWVANSFGTPVLFSNWAPRGITPFWEGTTVLKKSVFSLASGEDLPVDEQDREPVSQIESLTTLRNMGYGIRGSTPDEISEATAFFIKRYAPKHVALRHSA